MNKMSVRGVAGREEPVQTKIVIKLNKLSVRGV